jgi:hypothetical protein
MTGELDLAMGLFDRFQVGVGLPFTPYLTGDGTDPMGVPTGARLTESGIGDLRVEGKATLATLGRDDDYTLGLSAGATLPTGKSSLRPFLGDKFMTGRVKALALAQLGSFRAAANLGSCCAIPRTASPPSSGTRCSTEPRPPTRSSRASK